MGSPDAWVLFKADEAGLGSWLRRSAAAHTLLLGGGFAALLLVLVGELLAGAMPPAAQGHARAFLLAMAVASFTPLPYLAWQHARRRVLAVEVNPTGLVLTTLGGARAVPLAAIAEVGAVAEPVFVEGGLAARGASRLHGFAAGVRLRLADGSAWEFTSARPGDAEGVLAWLDLLGLGAKLRRPPSAFAARRSSRHALALASHLLVAAIGLLVAGLGLVLAARAGWLDLVAAAGLALFALALGCVLYFGSYLAQLQAAKAWLDARGLLAGPPVADLEASAAPSPPALSAAR